MNKEHNNNGSCKCKECLKAEMAKAMERAITDLQNVRDSSNVEPDYQARINAAIQRTNELQEVLRRMSAEEREAMNDKPADEEKPEKPQD